MDHEESLTQSKIWVRDDPTLFFKLEDAAEYNGASYCPVCMKGRLVQAQIMLEGGIFYQIEHIDDPPRYAWVCPNECQNPEVKISEEV
jgi:hypothetical protein